MSSERPELRASHRERDRVVNTLRIAAGEGRLTAEELDIRLERALSARTLGELAALTLDLPPADFSARDVLVIEQRGGKYERKGRWTVPPRVKVDTQLCRVTLDFTEAVATASTVRIELDMRHGKLTLVTGPGMVVDADGVELTFSKRKPAADNGGDVRLRIEVSGSLTHSRVVERRS